MKVGVDTLSSVGYKLRVMGVAAHVYGDKMSVIKNISKPESTLNKMSNVVGFHNVRVSVVQKIQQTQ